MAELLLEMSEKMLGNLAQSNESLWLQSSRIVSPRTIGNNAMLLHELAGLLKIVNPTDCRNDALSRKYRILYGLCQLRGISTLGESGFNIVIKPYIRNTITETALALNDAMAVIGHGSVIDIKEMFVIGSKLLPANTIRYNVPILLEWIRPPAHNLLKINQVIYGLLNVNICIMAYIGDVIREDKLNLEAIQQILQVIKTLRIIQNDTPVNVRISCYTRFIDDTEELLVDHIKANKKERQVQLGLRIMN